MTSKAVLIYIAKDNLEPEKAVDKFLLGQVYKNVHGHISNGALARERRRVGKPILAESSPTRTWCPSMTYPQPQPRTRFKLINDYYCI